MQGHAPSSSSSSSIRSGTVRTVRIEEEGEEEQQRLRKQLTRLGYAPAPWCSHRRKSEQEVISFLQASPIEMAFPDAVDLVNRFGAAACEASAIRTLAHMRGGTIVRKPRGLLIWALEKAKGWTPEQASMFIEEEWRQVIARARREARDSDDADLLALFGEEGEEIPAAWELDVAATPKNVVRLRETG